MEKRSETKTKVKLAGPTSYNGSSRWPESYAKTLSDNGDDDKDEDEESSQKTDGEKTPSNDDEAQKEPRVSDKAGTEEKNDSEKEEPTEDQVEMSERSAEDDPSIETEEEKKDTGNDKVAESGGDAEASEEELEKKPSTETQDDSKTCSNERVANKSEEAQVTSGDEHEEFRSANSEEEGVVGGKGKVDHADVKKSPTASYYSDANSEATEGPEEGFDEDQEALKLDRFEEELDEETAAFRGRIPRSFADRLADVSDEEDDDDDDDDRLEDEGEACRLERQNAREFVLELKEALPKIACARGSVEIDHRLQQFASNFCHAHSTHSHASADRRVVILNADGVYLASYCALHLNRKLALDGVHGGGRPQSPCPAERRRFVDAVLSSGLLVYVSPVWLSEVFDAVYEIDAFGLGPGLNDGKLNGLRNLLQDLEGFGDTSRGAQLLCDFKRFRRDVGRMNKDETEVEEPEIGEAGRRIARRILTTCWSSFLSHLLTSLGPYLPSSSSSGAGGGLSGLFRRSAPGKGQRAPDERLSKGIECLQSAASLCNTLELHDRCGEMLEPLTCFVCPEMNSNTAKKSKGSKSSSSVTVKAVNLVNLICVEDILKNGFELASQSQDCWKYVMR